MQVQQSLAAEAVTIDPTEQKMPKKQVDCVKERLGSVETTAFPRA